MVGDATAELVDLEKAYDTVPGDMTLATVKWVEMPEAETEIVEAMYKKYNRTRCTWN